MADGEPLLLEEGLDFRGQVEEAHRVGDGGPALADALGDVFLGEAEVFVQALVGGGLFNGIEILALEILDEGELEDLAVGGFPDDDRSFPELEFGGGTPAAFAGDELVLGAHFADDEGLDDAALADALDEFLQVLDAEIGPRLERAGNDLVERKGLDAFAKFLDGRWSGHPGVDQCTQPSAECWFCHHVALTRIRMIDKMNSSSQKRGYAAF